VEKTPHPPKTIVSFLSWFLYVFPGSKYKMKGSFVKANKGFKHQTYYQKIEIHNYDLPLSKNQITMGLILFSQTNKTKG
jgi:hypothetical protein